MDYKDTLLLLKSEFEMRGNLNIKEPLLVEKWKKDGLYYLMNENRKNCEEFALHDGPPYANGDIHCGHMLNKLLKDFVVRYKNMSGYKTPIVFGWDTHGLPIENQVTKSGINRKTTPIVEFRKKCEEYALKQVEHQKEQFLRLGVLGETDNPYLTLNKKYESRQIEVFKLMAKKGLIYKGLKPVYWSPSSESALAEAEIEYADVLSHSIYVAFKVKDGRGVLEDDTYLIIWTTTPWTIPANLAISVHPNFEYGLYQTNKGKFLFLREFEKKLKEELQFEDVKLLKTFKGDELEYIVCKHPLYDRDSVVIVGEHVTNEAGTGLVHTAPGHGQEDYQVCLKYNIKPYCPVDEKGRLTPDTGEFLAGLFYEEANDVVISLLREKGALLKHSTFTHSYPHDWRTHKPVIFRATAQWFCSIEPIRKQLLEEIHKVHWYPKWGESRMINMIKDRGDWCISRQRAWGVPLPIIYCEDGTPILEEKVLDHISELFARYGSNIWYEKSAKELLPEGYTNEHSPKGEFEKEKDIMDVWFDSGSSFNGTLIERGNKFPCDLYLEGSDQYRGWFNSSLIVSTGSYDKAPYQNVISHGWVLDEHGEQMHKSKGNGVDPNKIANQYGADILRLWTATVDYQQDVRIGDNLIKQTADQYRKIRNTLKFLSCNIVDYEEKEVTYSKLDQYILEKYQQVVNTYIEEFDRYNFSAAINTVMTFMSSDLSSFYLDVCKDILYCDQKDSPNRRSIQKVLVTISEGLLRLLNPILPFTMDEFNKVLPGERKYSPQLLDMVKSRPLNNDLLNDYKKLLSFRSDVLKALELKRNEGVIGSSLQAEVKVKVKEEDVFKFISNFTASELAMICGVGDIEISLAEADISVLPHGGFKCERCRNYRFHTIVDQDGGHLCERCQKVLGL